ncbi:lamin tail domain-containing protein [Hyalangium rubrum]|uniref:Lamin tail domain-containing protein n=1 Tax=Hyalangium rubrum TaxID=3103134 RepID=A0ABU5GXC1_9BACT|nr:lamin tail domain-containing protein [Hyalangium sp. s54d21]MDY7225504.1 lamin tail domain-containing protein [Hyalangium sp. s54d21]
MRSPRLSLAPLVCCLALLPTLALAQNLRFTTIDIGQGDSAVLVAPSGCAVLFDGGPTGSGTTIKAYLKSIGVTRLQMVFVSHLHADHMGGIDEVDVGTDAVPIDAVYDHGGTYSSGAYDEYATHFGARRHTASLGQTFSLCNEVTLEVVNSGSTHSDENSKSVAVKISYGAFDALVGGDLTGATPDIETGMAPRVGEVELYKVHHHGSKYSSNAPFLATLLPTVSFISVGIGNTYGHPTPECLARLADVGSAVWMTEDPSINQKLGHIALTSANGSSFTVSQANTSTTYLSKGGTPDTEAPTAPSALVASAASFSEIDLSWSAATDNVGVTGYRVYRSTNGSSFAPAGTSGTPGFADLGLSSSTTYWYQVSALDAAGNESPVSNTASATTSAPPATFLTLTSPNGGESWSGGSSKAITWSSSNVSNVKLEYTLFNGGSWTVIASSVAASTGSYTWTLPNTASTQARIRASDAQNGTPMDTSDGVFTVTASGPGQVILNEILANEPGSDEGGEFVELVNVGGTSVDLSGWKLWDGAAARHTFPTGTTLAPGKALVVFASGSAIPSGLTNAMSASTGVLSLNNTGDTVSLKNASKKTVTSYAYTGSQASTDGVSLNRGPDASASGAFVLHTTLSTRTASPGTRTNGTAF